MFVYWCVIILKKSNTRQTKLCNTFYMQMHQFKSPDSDKTPLKKQSNSKHIPIKRKNTASLKQAF